MSELDRPWVFPSDWSVERGRDAYLAQNGFSVAEYDQASSLINYAGITLRVPNPRRRRWAIRLHDLHHVATGFGTDPVGEAEISAWELRHGIRRLGLYVGALVVWGALVGLMIAPRRTWRAFCGAGRGDSLFGICGLTYEALLKKDIGELRELLGVPAHGIASDPPRLHAGAPRPPEPDARKLSTAEAPPVHVGGRPASEIVLEDRR